VTLFEFVSYWQKHIFLLFGADSNYYKPKTLTPMMENSTLVYVINDFYKENNLLFKNDLMSLDLDCSFLIDFLRKVESAPPERLVRKILLDNL
jgi:hypothetical protein